MAVRVRPCNKLYDNCRWKCLLTSQVKTNTEKSRTITSMVPYCFADDIDEYVLNMIEYIESNQSRFLKSKSLPILNSLKSNQTLIDAYAKLMQSPR
jgi:hypothetical protein